MCCDLIILIILCRKIASIANDKGRSGVGYVFLLIALFLGGEFSGAFSGAILAIATGADSDDAVKGFAAIGGIAGLIVGSLIAFGIVHSLSDTRDELPLRDRGFDDRDWRDREDYRRRFGSSSDRDDYTKEPPPRPQDEDDRYRTE
jgi:hypothetical protein